MVHPRTSYWSAWTPYIMQRNCKVSIWTKILLAFDCVNRKFIIVYADDILLIAQSVSELTNILRACEKELITIDMKINVKKSCCMRVEPRCNANCANLQTSRWSIFTMGLWNEISRDLRYQSSFLQMFFQSLKTVILWCDQRCIW